MKYLVTGGNGFIGKAFVDEMRKQGQDVLIYDKSTGHDMADRDLLSRAIRSYKPNWVIHLAAIPGVSGAISVGLKDIDNTATLLMSMGECENLLFVSTGSVYGQQKVFPTPEDAPMYPQVSYYANAKLSCEGLISAYCGKEGKNAVVLRLGTIIGPSNNKGLIRDFVEKLKANPTGLDVLGDGYQVKSYLHIDDLVTAMTDSMRYVDGFEVYNVAGDEFASVRDCIPWICDEMKLKPAVYYGTSQAGFFGDIPRIELDNSKLRRLGWKPRYTIEDAVRANVRYLLEQT